LGNHDFIEMVPGLEQLGLPILLNESVAIERGGSTLHLAGIDDTAFYKTYNLAAACHYKPIGSVAILLAHSPDVYRSAQVSCFDLVLCGHTHGGQICLPGRVPLVRNADCPSRMLAGAWQYKGLKGYTSRGTGGCGVAVRYFCPPEITLHILHQEA
jgi:predicted MPP superfamily phosphohydrolase